MQTNGLSRGEMTVEHEPPESAARPLPADGAKPRILVIDDESLLGQTLQLGLEENLDVELEVCGQKGLDRLLAGEQFQLVLCDLSLPDLSGAEVHRQALAARPELASSFVVMTGGAITRASREFLGTYLGPLLQKPFTLSEVEDLAKRLLKSPVVP